MLIRSLKKSPEVVLIWLKEQDGAEEAGKSDVVACRPVWFMETALNPTNLSQEPNGYRAEGEVPRGARSGDHRIALQEEAFLPRRSRSRGAPSIPAPQVLALMHALLHHLLILFLSAPWPRLMGTSL